ncbi:hypothetical protein D3C73_488210 [compost metagenome]
MAAIIQILMYVVWPEIFGENHLVPLLNVLVASLYVVFRLALWLEGRRKEEEVRIDSP